MSGEVEQGGLDMRGIGGLEGRGELNISSCPCRWEDDAVSWGCSPLDRSVSTKRGRW